MEYMLSHSSHYHCLTSGYHYFHPKKLQIGWLLVSLPVTGWVSHFSFLLSFSFPSILVYITTEKDIHCHQSSLP